jgi:hypothetical protein
VGTVTSPGGTTVTVSFASLGTTNYRAVVIPVSPTGGIGSGANGCLWSIEGATKTPTGFQFSCRAANNGSQVSLTSGLVFEYIAIIDN